MRGHLVFITPGTRAPAVTLSLVREALHGGAGIVLLREKQLDAASREALARDVAAAVHASGATLLVHGDPALARRCGADGVQLGFGSPSPGEARALAPGLLVGRSAHWPLQPADLQADLLLLSPFRPTHASVPRPLLTHEQVEEVLARTAPAPVFALGGLGAGDIPTLPAGLAGLAVIRAIADADDPRAAAAALCAALDARLDRGTGRLARTLAGPAR